MFSSEQIFRGTWSGETDAAAVIHCDLQDALPHLDKPLFVIRSSGTIKYATGGAIHQRSGESGMDNAVIAMAPPCIPEFLGDPSFCADHQITYPCYAGSMAHGIASEQLVAAMGKAGMLGFFGSAGLSLDDLEQVLLRLSRQLGSTPFGVNLINTPGDAAWEQGAVELFLRHKITRIEASAYMLPTAALVKYRVKGLTRTPDGLVAAPNRIIAKVSRMEVARRFFEPPSQKLLDKLLANGDISEAEARLAAFIPLAGDVTVEADSGGHTDHRPALPLFSSMLLLAEELQKQYSYARPLRLGLAGGVGTPAAAAAAFAMGAAYIVTGSINQGCVESGASEKVRAMLALAAQTDVADAPAADMFEMGIKVQVLKKGVRFAERAARLYELYRQYEGIDEIPEDEREKIEQTIFQQPLEAVWDKTRQFFEKRNPRQVEKALKNPKHKMALVFRWYLGSAVHWANAGIENRVEDYQIWCGPAMGAFNDWAKGSFLDEICERSAPVVALNLLWGAARLLRLQTLRAQGVAAGSPVRYITPVKDLPYAAGQAMIKEDL